MPGPPTIRVEGGAFNTQCNMRLNLARLWCPPLIDGAPSRRTVNTWFTQDCPGRRNLQTRNARIVPSELLSISDQFDCTHRVLGRFKPCSARYHAVLHV